MINDHPPLVHIINHQGFTTIPWERCLAVGVASRAAPVQVVPVEAWAARARHLGVSGGPPAGPPWETWVIHGGISASKCPSLLGFGWLSMVKHG